MKQRLEAVEAPVPPPPQAGETWRRSGSWSQERQERTRTQASLRHQVLTEHLLGPGPGWHRGVSSETDDKDLCPWADGAFEGNYFFGGDV